MLQIGVASYYPDCPTMFNTKALYARLDALRNSLPRLLRAGQARQITTPSPNRGHN